MDLPLEIRSDTTPCLGKRVPYSNTRGRVSALSHNIVVNIVLLLKRMWVAKDLIVTALYAF